MAKYQLRPVVVDHRKGVVVHYGPITHLEATDIASARAEVDRLPVRVGGNCLQILDGYGTVVTHRMQHAENGGVGWR